jgi:RNA-binding protein
VRNLPALFFGNRARILEGDLQAEQRHRTQNIWRTPPFRYAARMAEAITNRELRALKVRAQLLKPMLKIGKDGLSPAFLKATDDALAHHELVKVKFDDFKDQKKELTPKLADAVSAQLIMQVGHVVVLFRRKAVPAHDSSS